MLTTTAPARNPLQSIGSGRPDPASEVIRIFVICDQPLFRLGLSSTIATEPTMSWLGEAATSTEALRAPLAHEPDVVLIDEVVAGAKAIAIMEALRPRWPRARYAMLTPGLEPSHLRRAVAAGASGMVHKSESAQELLLTLRAAHRGAHALSPRVAAAIANSGSDRPELGSDLTPRERDLLKLMAQGLDNREISHRLAIAVPTVKFHVTHILSKLGTDNRTAAVLAALRHRIVQLEDSAPQPRPGVLPAAAAGVAARPDSWA